MVKRLTFLLLLFSSIQSYAQLYSSRPSNLVPHEELVLPTVGDAHEVLYSEQVPQKDASQAVLHERSKHWFCDYFHLPARLGKTWSKASDGITNPGVQLYQLQEPGHIIPYKLHYFVALYTANGSYRYDINGFEVELVPGQDRSQSVSVPLEQYLNDLTLPPGNHAQLVAQLKQQVDDCAYKVAESLKRAMSGQAGESKVPSRVSVTK